MKGVEVWSGEQPCVLGLLQRCMRAEVLVFAKVGVGRGGEAVPASSKLSSWT